MDNKIQEIIKETASAVEHILPAKKETVKGGGLEARPEKQSELEKALSEKNQFPVVKTGASGPPQSSAPAISASPIVRRVENILEDGLAHVYAGMDKATQAKFKMDGEQTALKISQLLNQAKLQIKKIFDLIVAWLRIIPGINQHYLEQEAKIKTDRILALENERLENTK